MKPLTYVIASWLLLGTPVWAKHWHDDGDHWNKHWKQHKDSMSGISTTMPMAAISSPAMCE
jgi:hypothetical protein